MTRSHKQNDRDHQGLADGTATADQHLPRYFAKNGHIDADPKKTKKDGAGKGNWGREGDEIDEGNFNFTKARRRSNSSSVEQHNREFKTKFETIDPEPVFEEEVHGASTEDGLNDADKESSISDGGSYDHGEGSSVDSGKM